MTETIMHEVQKVSHQVERLSMTTFYLELEVKSMDRLGGEHYDKMTLFFGKNANIGQIADALHNASERLMEFKDPLDDDIPF